MITLPCYCTREDVKKALDIKATSRSDSQIDDSIDAASRSVEGLLRRRFYPEIKTCYFDWPNYQYAYPWRLWLDNKEIADITTLVPVLESGGVVIPAGDAMWRPENDAPPYTYLELDRSTVAAFGVNKTPQRDISILAAFGFWTRTVLAGVLSVGCGASDATVSVSIGSLVGVGDNILVDSERMLVTDRSWVSTAQTQTGSGLTTASMNDNLLAPSAGTWGVGESLLLDAETVLVTGVAGSNLIVKRAWDGSILAAHSNATIYASRTLSVTRGALGTTAASHSGAASVSVAVVPSLVRELTIAEAEVAVLQKQGGYSRSQGSGENKQTGIGDSLQSLRDRCEAAFGRSSVRQRTI